MLFTAWENCQLQRIEEQGSPQGLKEYGVDLFAKVRQTLLDVLTLKNLPNESRSEMQETLVGVEQTLDILRKSLTGP